MKLLSDVQLFAVPRTARLLCPWDSPGKNTGVGCPFILQVIFPTQCSNSGLPHCRDTPYCLSHQGNSELQFVGTNPPLVNCHRVWLTRVLEKLCGINLVWEASVHEQYKKNSAECTLVVPNHYVGLAYPHSRHYECWLLTVLNCSLLGRKPSKKWNNL